MKIEEKQKITSEWFRLLRDKICAEFEKIEEEFAVKNNLQNSGKFERKNWDREGGGSGEMSLMKGNVFEKVGVKPDNNFG